jgi:hypothetical protein
MRRVRGFLTGYLALVALSVLVREGPSKRIAGKGGLLDWISSAINRALSPGVAAIPDYAHGAKGSSGGAKPTGGTAQQPRAGAMAAAGVQQSAAMLGTRPTTNLYQSGH